MARRSRSPSNLRPQNDGVARDPHPHLGVAQSTLVTDAAGSKLLLRAGRASRTATAWRLGRNGDRSPVVTTLTITATHNYTADSLPANVTDIVFNTSGSTFATFAATHFGGNPISDSVHITGDGFRNTLIVNLSGTFSAAGWTFSSWGSTDQTILAGSSGAD